MKPSKLIIHSAIASVFFGMAVHVNATPIKTENLQSFYERVAKDQATPSDLNTVVSSNPLEQKALQKSMPGLFSSYVHFNFSQSNSKFIKPKWLTSTIRDHLKIYDGNFFVTAWIVENLLQAHQFAPTAFTLNQGLLDHAITALGQFHDKNAPQTAQISFWPQIYDTDQHVWTAYPSNLMAITEKQGMFYNWMMGVCMNAFPNNGVCFQIYNELPPIFSDAFAIPSDNDDSALNLVMGESVMSAAKEYPNAAAIWASRNSSTQIANYFRALLRTTYHMASANADAHTIDPRTYYFLRNDPKVASSTYITTWLDSISQERILVQDKADTMPKVAMPFNVNNIDPSVNANTLYALSKLSNQSPLGEAALSQLSEQERAELQTIELSTAHFLSWVINNRLALDRPDIVTIYYPSKYNLIWFSSKIDAYLHNTSAPLNANWSKIQRLLNDALTTHATQDLLALAHTKNNLTFWDDFLGDADISPIANKTVADDRLYSTAVNTNALLNIWTESSPDQQNKIVWKANTPEAVKESVLKAANFLKIFGNLNWYRHENAFFSGSVKGMNSLPANYFGNFDQFLNGDPYVKGDQLLGLRVYGVANSINPDDYSKWLINHGHAIHFTSFNDDFPFPYWSAPSLTDSIILLALAKTEALI